MSANIITPTWHPRDKVNQHLEYLKYCAVLGRHIITLELTPAIAFIHYDDYMKLTRCNIEIRSADGVLVALDPGQRMRSDIPPSRRSCMQTYIGYVLEKTSLFGKHFAKPRG
jgi:hypothetical protein